MKVFVACQCSKFVPEVTYVMQTFASIWPLNYVIGTYDNLESLDECNVVITYGKNKPKIKTHPHLHIHMGSLFGPHFLTEDSLPHEPLSSYSDGDVCDLPVFYGLDTASPKVRYGVDGIESDLDVFAGIFFVLTRYEELFCSDLDKHQRVPCSTSLSYRQRFLNRPVVNEYMSLLWKWLEILTSVKTEFSLWGEHKFVFCLSHDIDNISKFGVWPLSVYRSLRTFLACLSRKTFHELLPSFKEFFLSIWGIDPYHNIECLKSLDDNLRVRASWFFMTGGKNVFDGYGYDLHKMKRLITMMTTSNLEIGFHPSYDTFDDQSLLVEEATRFQRLTNQASHEHGIRQHYLRVNISETFKWHQELGFKYDTSLGYAECLGFRSGICHPYQPYDFESRKAMSYWQIPLLVMDATLKTYLELSPTQAMAQVVCLLNEVQKHGGVFTLLWHNSSFDAKWYNWRDFYQELVNQVLTHNPLCLTGSELVDIMEKKKVCV